MEIFKNRLDFSRNLRRIRSRYYQLQNRWQQSKKKVERVIGAVLLSGLILGFMPEESIGGSKVSILGSSSYSGANIIEANIPATLTLTPTPTPGEVKGMTSFKDLNNLPESPELVPDSIISPEITAQAALFIDQASGTVLFEKNQKKPYPPASTTKMMTAIISMELFSLSEVVSVPETCTTLSGTQRMGLTSGEKISVEDLLSGLIIQSAADAACALASHGGDIPEFARKMNEKAEVLGLEETSFSNPIGLDVFNGEINYSSASDLIILAREFVNNPFLYETMQIKTKEVTSIDRVILHQLRTTNELLSNGSGFKGIKTGQTQLAKGCFVSLYKRGERTVLGVVLGSNDRFGETESIIDWIFSVYSWP